MKEKRRRRIIIIVLLLLLAIAGIFILTRLAGLLAPSDSGAAGECSRLAFDQVPLAGSTQSIPTTEDMVISNQYIGSGYSFRNGPRFDGSACDRAFPFIAKQGDPFRSFGNNTLNLSDMPAVGQTFGPSWLTNESWDGTTNQQNRPCSLEIVFDTGRTTNAFSFDILDLDFGERWIVEGFANAGDTTPAVTRNVNATNDAAGDGRAFRVEVNSVTPLSLIRIRPAILQKADGGSWGLGFDNFAAYCINEPVSICGNGQIETGEVCDDANTVSGDGCSATCQMETIDPGRCFNIINIIVPTTSTANSSSAPVCPNGIVEPGEQCDDGNTIPNDGCSPTCTIDQVLSSSASSSIISSSSDISSSISSTPSSTGPMCPNGIQEEGEACDDGNMIDTDSCSNTCQLNTSTSTVASTTSTASELPISSSTASELPISSAPASVPTSTPTSTPASVPTSVATSAVTSFPATSTPPTTTTGGGTTGTATTTGGTTSTPGLPDTAIGDSEQGLFIWLGLILIFGGIIAARTRLVDAFLAGWAEVTDFRKAQNTDFETAMRKSANKNKRK